MVLSMYSRVSSGCLPRLTDCRWPTSRTTMKSAVEDLENRRRAWEALSDLYLDTDTSLSRQWRAAILAASPYSLEELEQILVEEIHPACRSNLLCVAGEWAGFDMEWLEQRILRRVRSRSPLRRFTLARLTVPRSTEWQRTKEEVVRLRKA